MGRRKKESANAQKEAKKALYVAKLRNNPTSPRKTRLVADMVRGVDVDKALGILKYCPRESAPKMYKLINMLIAQGIPFEVEESFGTPHICYPSRNERVCSVICHWFSYGNEKGLLEIMGLLTEEESEYDNVIGYLTANDVFKRINTDYHCRDHKDKCNLFSN